MAAKPLALTRHHGRTILFLNDPGGESLDRILERDHGQPFELTRFLRIAIGSATALGHAHRHGLLHEGPSGGTLAGAKLTVTNEATNTVRTAETDAAAQCEVKENLADQRRFNRRDSNRKSGS